MSMTSLPEVLDKLDLIGIPRKEFSLLYKLYIYASAGNQSGIDQTMAELKYEYIRQEEMKGQKEL